MQHASRKRERINWSSDEDGSAPSRRSGRRSGRNSAPNYDWNSDDPDFDADDPSFSQSSDESENSSSESLMLRRKVQSAKNVPSPIDVDINLFCDDCAQYYEGDCSVHGALPIVKDTPVPRKANNETRARKTAPPLVRVADTKSGGGVWAKNFIPSRTLFGPYQGKVVSKDVGASTYVWEIKRNGSVVHCIDASDPGMSNWLRYVNRAPLDGEQNLNAYQYQGDIYFRTIRNIQVGQELVVYDGYTHGRQRAGKKKTNATVVNKTYKCPGCKIAYISQDYVDRHIKSCRQLRYNDCASEIFKCTGCQCAYSSFDYLERHKKVCRKSEASKPSAPMFKCSGCKCAYATEDYLQRHKKLCKELGTKKASREAFPCPGCKCAYSTVEYLDRHKKICKQLESQKPTEKTFKCHACQTAYADPNYLERHMKVCRQMDLTKTSETLIKYECSACHSVYTDQMFLERHKKICDGINSKNINEKPSYECGGCRSVYGNLEFFDRHKVNCSELKSSMQSELKCSTCPRSFPDQTLLNRHKVACVKLSSCFQDALEEEEKEERIFDEDSGDDFKKPNPSSSVPKRKNSKSSVGGVKEQAPVVLVERIAWFDPLLHETTHYNVPILKPLKCPDCNEPFTYKARMDTHRLVHLAQTLNVCVECDMAFCNKKLYAEHVESHS